MDALRAAFSNGADAVYLGADAFGARASAGFDDQTLKDALRIAHLRRKKIYITVNILVKERELSDVRRTLSLLSDRGADAVLVQDLGVMKICREEFPLLPVHASTQMAIHNAQGAKWLKTMGASRAVLARECDLDTLRACAQTGIEIEAFCHGALCVSCSGQCLFSSMIGGRSGNRGRCAQPCRLPYTYLGQTGALLSPRDLCARDQLQQMADAGVYSFKIEGRLKRPEYVAVVTRAYRDALDRVLEGRFAPMDGQEKEALTQIFSRGGFTQGYTAPHRDAALIDPTRVTPAGVPLGTVERVIQKSGVPLAQVRLAKTLHNGDGLDIDGQTVIYSGPDVSAGERAQVRVRPGIHPGQEVRRTEDEQQLADARKTYEGEGLNRALPLSFDAVLAAYPGAPLQLTVTDGESTASVTGEVCQAADSRALDEDSARRALAKTGGTPFVLRQLVVRTGGAFVAASALNALRRQALEQLTEKRIAAQPRHAAQPARWDAPALPPLPPRLLVKTDRIEDCLPLRKAGAQEILFQPQDYREGLLLPLLRQLPQGARLCLPAQCKDDTLRAILRLKGDRPVVLSSPGQMGLGDMAGEGVPVMNGEAMRFLFYQGCRSLTLSRELAREEILDLPAMGGEVILPVYGRARLMLLNHCPRRTALGLKTGREACDLCAQGKGAVGTRLTDRLGAAYPLFPLRLPEGCVIELMDRRPLHLGEQLRGLPPLSWLLTFTDEPQARRLEITRYYAALLRGEHPPSPRADGSLGRFEQGVF